MLFLLVIMVSPAGASRGPTYKGTMKNNIAQNWHPKKTCKKSPVVSITIRKDGRLLDRKILKASGKKSCDKEALKAIDATSYAPLPTWFKGETIEFKVDMAELKPYLESQSN